MKIAFVVPGKPVGKGRPRASTVGGYVHMHTPEATVTYENWVRACYLQNHAGVRLEGQLTMELMKKIANKHGFACLLHEKTLEVGLLGSYRRSFVFSWSSTGNISRLCG